MMSTTEYLHAQMLKKFDMLFKQTQVKKSQIEMMIRNYEFSVKDFEAIQEMITRFTIITNKFKSLGKVFIFEELISKVLWIFPASWEMKVTAIQEANKLDKIS